MGTRGKTMTGRAGCHHRSARRGPGVGALALLLTGCAISGGIAVPPANRLTLLTSEQGIDFRWTVEREAGRVRAVGWAETRQPLLAGLGLQLFGLDEHGRIVSRGLGVIRPGFGSQREPFAVVLTPTGREVGYALQVLGSGGGPRRGGPR